MRTHGYDDRDPGNNDEWFEGEETFPSVVAELARTVEECAFLEEDE
jgi:hypothetical protein